MEESSVEKVKTRRLKKKKPVVATEEVPEDIKKKRSKKKKTVENKENVNPVAVPKKKSTAVRRDPLGELKQGEHVVDYQRLHDALRESFSIDDTRGDIYFAPLISKSQKFEKSPISSMSANTSESRNCNKSAPSAKSKNETIKSCRPLFLLFFL